MYKIVIAMVCLLGVGQGRRIQTPKEEIAESSEVHPVKTLLTALLALGKAGVVASPGAGVASRGIAHRARRPVTMVERRRDPDDGTPYTQPEFEDFYGADAWQAKWDTAEVAPDMKGMEDFTVGEEVEAKILRIAPFGAFCDIGATQDALLHISQIKNEFISDINDHVEEGQVLKVKIKELDQERGRIGLTCRDDMGAGGPAVDPNATPLSEFTVGQEVEGTVKSVASFGAFLNIGAQKDALLHITEIADEYIEDINDRLSVGQTVTCKVKEVDVAAGRIGVSCKDNAPPATNDDDDNWGD
jgi:predicted RNA-binding protein with RPS1 domain